MNTETTNEAEVGAEPLRSLRPRDTRQAAARSDAHSRRIGLLRWILPALVLVVLAAVVVWPMAKSKTLSAIVADVVPNLMVENLHLTGIDADNQPYSLTAARAMQAGGDRNMVDLEKPQGEVTLNDGAWLAGRAGQGRYDQKNKKLWLGDAVELFHDQGYRFTTEAAQVDMNNNNAWGEKPVLIQGPFGEIQGQGFRLLDRGAVLIVTGHAKAILNLQEGQPSDKPEQP